MKELLQSPIFYIGIAFGLFIRICWDVLKEHRLLSRANCAASTGQHIIDTFRDGTEINLSIMFAKRTKSELAGFITWEALAFWLAKQYANYTYKSDKISDFWGAAEMCFGKSAAFLKLQALDEILNRSTKFITKENGLGYFEDEKPDLTGLYTMVASIVDSFRPEVYERCRKDIGSK